jgi:hypothetical protein
MSADAIELTDRAAPVVTFLQQALSSGAVAVFEIEAWARVAGLLGPSQKITDAKLFKRAKKILGVRSKRVGFGGKWFWELPPQANSTTTDIPAEATDLDGQSNSKTSCVEASAGQPPPFLAQVQAINHRPPGVAAWIDRIASLNYNRAPADIPLQRWQQFIDDCKQFLDRRERWAERAVQKGWDALALFGCNSVQPLSHLGAAGLLWAINGGRIVEFHRGWAEIECADGTRRSFDQKRSQLSNIALPWALLYSSTRSAA